MPIEVGDSNRIAREISLSIKEGKWLYVLYDSKKEKRHTSFWCFIKDIDPVRKKLFVSCFNEARGVDTIEVVLAFERILEAKVLSFSTGDFNAALVNKINENLSCFEWLSFENFDNNILEYLKICLECDSDPYIKDYAMIEGLDANRLDEEGEISLSDSQIHTLVRYILKYDLEEYESKRNELALSRISIDIENKKYIVAYRNILFSPSEKSIKIKKGIKVNSSFLIGGSKHSLRSYTEMDANEFKDLLETNFLEAANVLREGLKPHQKLDTRPDFYCIQRDFQIHIDPLFEKISKEWNEGTLSAPLKAFFGNSSLSNNGKKLPNIVLFDNRVNIDQALLIYGALKNKATYVQGPPGTGKTQTIFNTILSAFFDLKNVLISTNNNRPLDGIVEKFRFRYNEKDIRLPYLRLGNAQKIKEATLFIRSLLEMDFSFSLKKNELEELRKKVLSKNKDAVRSLTNFQKRRAALENLKFLEKVESLGARRNIVLKQRLLLEREVASIPIETEEEIISRFVSLANDEEALRYLYFSSISHFKKLENPRFHRLREIVAIEEESERVLKFNGYLSDNRNLQELLEVFPIVFCTNISSFRLGDGGYRFDLLIMDEAGQCDIVHSLIPIARADSLLLVGDEDQLLPVISLDEAWNEELKKEFKISDTYDYLGNSILSTMKAADKVTNRLLLHEHYRCAKKIINFNNSYFYHGALKISSALKDGEVFFVDSKSDVRTNLRNQNFEEAKNVVAYCLKRKVENASIITPFVNQASLINALLDKEGLKSVRASTIHSVQGDEKETIILSMGISRFTSQETIRWLDAHGEIANVAVSRAKKRLVVFGDEERLSKVNTGDSVWKDLITYCKEKGEVEVIPSSYRNLSIGKSNGSLSEDEFYETIQQIVSIHKRLKILRNVPLEGLFGQWGEKGMEFDSVIYEKSLFEGFKAIYAFEFDGGEHYRDEKRMRLDSLKADLCAKKGIRLIRLPNSFSKDYEFLKSLIEGYKDSQEAEQLALF